MAYHNKESQLVYDERVEGIPGIMRVIDPKMSDSTFYRKWRRYMDPVIMEYETWWRRKPPTRYFSFRRLIIAKMLERGKI